MHNHCWSTSILRTNSVMTSISRRQTLSLVLSGTAAFALGPPGAFAQSAAPALPMPRLVEPRADGTLALEMIESRHVFKSGGKPIPSRGFSTNYLGPVLRLRTGSTVRPAVANWLDEMTTVHWHGLMVPSEFDGGPHNPIAPGAVWKPELTIRQRPSTAWFHPHTHRETARQTYQGLAGMMIITDGGDRDRGLPDRYGIDDLPLIIQDRRLASADYAPDLIDLLHGFRGDTIVVNGLEGPVGRVPRGLVRLRMLNGANARNFEVALSDRRPMHVIASDGGYSQRPSASTAFLSRQASATKSSSTSPTERPSI